MSIDTAVWREQMTKWLETFHWVWFAHLTFRPGLSERQCWWRLRHWIGELKDELGAPDFGWFAAREFGRTGADTHFHVLIAGIKEPDAPQRLAYARRWTKLAGDGRVDLYFHNERGISYLLKDTSPDDPDGYDFQLTDTAK